MRQANNKNKLKHEIHEQANETHRKKTHHLKQNENNSDAKNKRKKKTFTMQILDTHTLQRVFIKQRKQLQFSE